MLAKAGEHVGNYSPLHSPPLTPIACRWGQVLETRLEHLLLTVHPRVHSSDAFSAFVKLRRAMSQPLTREREGRRNCLPGDACDFTRKSLQHTP